jgi:hypothetical protein
MTIDPSTSSLAPEPPLDLLRHIDCIVMLLPANASEAAAAAVWAELLARRIRVVLVTSGAPGTNAPEPVAEGRLIRVTLPPSSPTDRDNWLNRTLRHLGLIRPLLWLEDPLQAGWFRTCYAPFKVVVLRNHDLQPLLQSLPQADAVLLSHSALSDNLPAAVRGRCRVLPVAPTETQIREFCQLTSQLITSRPPTDSRLNIAILYDHTFTYTNTVREFLESFALYSRHRVFYVPASNYHPNPPTQADLSMFDVVIIHYSIRLCFNTLLPVYAQALLNFGGLKACFIQDEYDYTEVTRRAIDRLGFQIVFTCVPDTYRDRIYPQDRFQNVDFFQVLTGYVPLELETQSRYKPFRERRFVIGYRGRSLPAWYGDLSREKLLIATRVRDACRTRDIPVDIEWDDDQRIYGDQWYEFMRDCRATLGTESGSNVFDDHGDIRQAIQRAVQRNPDLDYETIHSRYLAEHDGLVQMNQVSPRIFEAIALRTALVLFEGEYSGVIAAEQHYIPLKKDLSNIDDVFDRLADDTYLEALTTRAWEDIVESGRYSYRSFVSKVDGVIDRQGYRGTGTTLLTAVVAARAAEERQWQWRPTDRTLETFSAFTTGLIDFEQKPPLAPPIVVEEAVPRPEGRLQAVKWWIADVLYRHSAVYLSIRAVYRGVRFVLRPVRRGYRGLRALFEGPSEVIERPTDKVRNVRP